MIFLLSLLIVGALILQDFFLLCFFYFNYKEYKQEFREETLPKVSILIPARNEELRLPACLRALEKIDYPKEKLEIVVADDQSQDKTAAILKTWSEKAPGRIFLKVGTVYPGLNGKANALAQMVKRVSGELLLFTDADCQVNPKWVREMVGAFKPTFGFVIGVTKVKGKGLFSHFQGMEWWLTLGTVKVTADMGELLTAVGNNMMVSKEAYEAVGGYENLPFSVTEDFELGRALKSKGYRPVHQMTAGSLVSTKAEKNFFRLMLQRKRWVKGALGLSWYWQLMLALQALFFPAVIVLMMLNSMAGGVLWASKVLVQGLFIFALSGKVGVKIPFWELFIFEVYYVVISWSTIVYYFWPSKINWKERKY